MNKVNLLIIRLNIINIFNLIITFNMGDILLHTKVMFKLNIFIIFNLIIDKFYFNKEVINSLNFIYIYMAIKYINKVHKVYSFFIKIEFIDNI